MAIALGNLNALPIRDGAITPYLWPTLKGKVPSLHSRKLLYVNGMATTPTAHKIAALCLSELAESYVVGVYNLNGFAGYQYSLKKLPIVLNDPSVPPAVKSAISKLNEKVGFGEDLLQCAWDWTSRTTLWIQKLYDIASDMNDSDRYMFMKRCVSINAATQSLLFLLMEELKSAPRIFLACHSQGNLIASNAISAASWVLGRSLQEIQVFALASPATGWPGGARVRPYTNLQDPVTWLSSGYSQFGTDTFSWVTGQKPWSATLQVPDVGIPGRPWTWFAAHSILEYIYQKDFIIDLRWAMRLANGTPDATQRAQLKSFGEKAGVQPRPHH